MRRNAGFTEYSLHGPAAQSIRDWQIRESLISDGERGEKKTRIGRVCIRIPDRASLEREQEEHYRKFPLWEFSAT